MVTVIQDDFIKVLRYFVCKMLIREGLFYTLNNVKVNNLNGMRGPLVRYICIFYYKNCKVVFSQSNYKSNYEILFSRREKVA